MAEVVKWAVVRKDGAVIGVDASYINLPTYRQIVELCMVSYPDARSLMKNGEFVHHNNFQFIMDGIRARKKEVMDKAELAIAALFE